MIPAGKFPGYGATIHALITSLFEGKQSDAFDPTGLEIVDPTGQLAFTYMRPAPSQE